MKTQLQELERRLFDDNNDEEEDVRNYSVVSALTTSEWSDSKFFLQAALDGLCRGDFKREDRDCNFHYRRTEKGVERPPRSPGTTPELGMPRSFKIHGL
ncbi:hypothetical protein AAC387_Pa06g0764 [Persea americana]